MARSDHLSTLCVVMKNIAPTDDEDAESLLLSINPQFQAILERSQRRLESDGGLSNAEVRARLGLQSTDA